MDEPKVGDVVKLKSGGPEMTIKLIDRLTGARCQWFVDDNLEYGDFSIASLQKVVKKDE